MTTSTITIQLYQADGRQWATVDVDSPDDPALALTEAVQALGQEISRFYLEEKPSIEPLDIGMASMITVSPPVDDPGPISVATLLGVSDFIVEDEVEEDPL